MQNSIDEGWGQVDLFKPLELQMEQHLEKNPGVRSELWLLNEFRAYGFGQRRDAIQSLKARGVLSICENCECVIAKRNFHRDLCSFTTN